MPMMDGARLRCSPLFLVCTALQAAGCSQKEPQPVAQPATQVVTTPTPEEEQALRASDHPCIPSRTGCADPSGETVCCPVLGSRASVDEGCWRGGGVNGVIACYSAGPVAPDMTCGYSADTGQMEEIDATGRVVAHWRIAGWSQGVRAVYRLREYPVPDEDPTLSYPQCP